MTCFCKVFSPLTSVIEKETFDLDLRGAVAAGGDGADHSLIPSAEGAAEETSSGLEKA